MTDTPQTLDQLLDYWLSNVQSKGKLVSGDNCMCAQEQALNFLGARHD